MNPVTLKLTLEEVELLASLASDQLFRREFIDPKMPGHRPNAGHIVLGKELVGRLRSLLNPHAPNHTSRNSGASRIVR